MDEDSLMGEFGQAASRSPDTSEIPVQRVREQLERILASPAFRASRRCQEVLRFLVEMTLDGRASELKERTIGVEVFHRPPSYDPTLDSTVRVKTGDVRRRLAQYYLNKGAEDGVIVEVPAGGYVPRFRPADGAGTGAPAVSGKRRSARVRVAATAAVAGALILAALFGRTAGGSHPALDGFWRPLLHHPSPVLLCLSYVPVYGLTQEAEIGEKSRLRPGDFVLRGDKFIGASDSLAADNIESAIRGLGGRSTLRIGGDVAFHDLRAAPSVLIGYSYTRWRELSGGLRYSIRTDPAPRGITEAGKPTRWVLPEGSSEDYGLAARVFDRETAQFLVLVAGIEGHGTEAAADLVSNEARLAEAIRGAPSDWPGKNIELVIHVRVVGGAAASPRVVARHFW